MSQIKSYLNINININKKLQTLTKLNLSRQLQDKINALNPNLPYTFRNIIFDSRILRRSICESSLSLSVSISAFFCVLIASSLLCAPGRNRLDQSRTSLEDFSREPVRPVYTLDLLFICSNLHCKNCSAFIEKEFIPVAFLSYTCNYYNRLYLIVSTNFSISWFTDFIGSFVVSELSV